MQLITTDQFVLAPSIFEDVARVQSVFTLVGVRDFLTPLGNNMSTVPGVITDGLKAAGYPDSEMGWAVDAEVNAALHRRFELAQSLGITTLSMASHKPVAGADFVDVNSRTIPDLMLNSPTRRSADIALITEPGFGSLIAPADCPVIDIVDPNTGGQVAQCHAGWQGILKGAVCVTMRTLIERGLVPSHALVNIHPNATDGFELSGDGLIDWLATFGGDFVTADGDQRFISMTDAVVAQLESFGVKRDRIQTSAQYSDDGQDLNSLTDDRFYSHRAKAQKGFGGRNAAVLVRVND